MERHASVFRRRKIHIHDQRNMSFGLENISSYVHSHKPSSPSSSNSHSFQFYQNNHEKENDMKMKFKKNKRLNSTQLQDLFHRLDINNDNELDLEEFLIVIQKLDVSSNTKEVDKDFLTRTFHQADLDKSGKLSLDEFLVAYDIFFNKKSESASDDHPVYCQAIRYGRIGGNYIMQSYSGSGFGRNVTFNNCVQLYPESEQMKSSNGEDKIEDNDNKIATMTFDDLISLIKIDSQKNLKRTEQNILWWVDLTCEEKSAGVVNVMMHKFGVPRELEDSLYSNRLSSLPDERLKFGVNTMRTTEKGDKPVRSFNVTIQSIWLKNLPVVQIQPNWIYRYTGGLKKWIMSLNTRFAPFLSYSHVPDQEKIGFIRHVADFLFTYCHSVGLAVPPAPKKQHLDFLLKPTDVEKRGLPIFEANTLSLHLLDLGATGAAPNCLLTFNRLEDESDIAPNRKAQFVAASGALGRTKEALKLLLLNVIQAGGVSASGHLVDSSFNILHLLIHLTHEVTLSHMTSRMGVWMNAIELGTKDLATTKQYFHIRSLLDMISVASDYVNPFKTSLTCLDLEDETTLLGKDISKISLLCEGDSHLDFKGVQHWEDKLQYIRSKTLDIKEEYRTKLDEQRNFWGFILALFSVFTFPATFSTGYWGMNFENMAELTTEYVPYLPGVKIMWFANAVAYSILFIFLMRYRIIEQAL